MANPESLLVLAARYDDLSYAGADYEAVKAIYENVKGSHGFDAAVVACDQDGYLVVMKRHVQPPWRVGSSCCGHSRRQG